MGIRCWLFLPALLTAIPKTKLRSRIKTIVVAMLLLSISPFERLLTYDSAGGTAFALDSPNSVTGNTDSDAQLLQGTWVFDEFNCNANDRLSAVWTTKLIISDDALAVDGFLGISDPIKGTIRLDSTADPKQFDMVLEELDLAKFGDPRKISAGKYPGIFKWEGDRLKVCFVAEAGGSRPGSFDAKGDKVVRATLMKAPAGFKSFPKQIDVKVLGADGAPANGAIVTSHMMRRAPVVIRGPDDKPIEPSKLTEEQKKRLDQINGPTPDSIDDEASGWRYLDAKNVGADGTAKVPYDFRYQSMIAFNPKNRQMGVARLSPWSLLGGAATVNLQPTCAVVIPVGCADLTKAGYAERERCNAYIGTMDGREIVSIGYEKIGQLEFLLPPGEFMLELRGNAGLMGDKRAKIIVPKDQRAFTAPAVAVPATEYLKLLGNSVPELSDVVAWKGEPVKLADQKGKIVLLEFWGYWCGGCIQKMPVLMELHQKFKDRGVVIIGIHVDADGDVDTAQALDEKLSLYKDKLWKGKDIPFPVALVSGKRESESEDAGRGTVANRYGVRGYPSTLIIDREGKLVGKLSTGDVKNASERIEYLLRDKKE
jgi:uncharacterized protein (TIGR03067 family)